MSDSRTWRLEIDADRIAWLSCDVPGTSTNVLSAAVLTDLAAALGELSTMSPTGVVVRSAKANGFVAGADIKEFIGVRTPEEAYALVRAGQAVFDELASLPCPSVAAVHGFALGGGLELALACRYRIGADDDRLSLGLPEVMLGIHPGFGGTVRTVRLIGARPALELMLTGKPLRSARALEVGLIDRLVPPAELAQRAKELLLAPPPPRTASVVEKLLNLAPVRPLVARSVARSLRRKVRPEHYPAPYAIVELWRRHGAVGAQSLEAEARSIGALMCSATSRNLVRVFMLQDRLKGLGGKTRREFRHLHVVGAGVMGGDIAAWAALRGMKVTLQDRSAELIEPALARARAQFDKRLRDPQRVAETLARLVADVPGEGIAQADVVIEAIVENAEAKRALYAAIERKLKPGAMFATNTSSIKIEILAEALENPARLVGIHFFNPVAQMQLVEIVRGAGTSAEAAQEAVQFARALDKLPLPCTSAPGFVVNRILTPYINEALFALEEGVPAAVIDRAGTLFGMPIGPVELADVVGLDVALNVGRVLAQAFHRSVPASLVTRVEQGKLGRKSGEGFYRWQDGKAQRARARQAAIPPDLEDRLILPMLNESAACLRERIVDDADLLDAGAVFATGFAPFRGGPVNYARARGIDAVIARLAELEKRHGERFAPDPGWNLLRSAP